MTLVGLLAGGWSPENPSSDEQLRIFSPAPHFSDREEGLEMELIIG